MVESAALRRALDALEAMCEQYLATSDPLAFDHMAMSTGEEACDVLCQLRPERWRPAPRGMTYVGPGDDPAARW